MTTQSDTPPPASDAIVVIGDAVMTTGFRLAGVTDTHTVEDADVEKTLRSQMNREDAGLIIISDRNYETLSWKLKKHIEATAKPVVVPVPDRHGSVAQEESLRELVKRAMGLDLLNVEV